MSEEMVWHLGRPVSSPNALHSIHTCLKQSSLTRKQRLGTSLIVWNVYVLNMFTVACSAGVFRVFTNVARSSGFAAMLVYLFASPHDSSEFEFRMAIA